MILQSRPSRSVSIFWGFFSREAKFLGYPPTHTPLFIYFREPPFLGTPFGHGISQFAFKKDYIQMQKTFRMNTSRSLYSLQNSFCITKNIEQKVFLSHAANNIFYYNGQQRYLLFDILEKTVYYSLFIKFAAYHINENLLLFERRRA